MRDTSELRKLFMSDLYDLRKGKITRAEARARALVGRNILDTLKIEIASHAMNISHYQPVLLDCEPTTFLEAAE